MCIHPVHLQPCSQDPTQPSRPLAAGEGELGYKAQPSVSYHCRALNNCNFYQPILMTTIIQYIYEYGYCGSSWAMLLLLSEIPYMVLCVLFNLPAKLWFVLQELVNLELMEENRTASPVWFQSIKLQTIPLQNVEIKNYEVRKS